MIKVKLPAVLSADLRLNEPRYATLPNIMVSWGDKDKRFIHFEFVNSLMICMFQKAKKKPIKKVTPKDLNVETNPRIEVLSVEEPPVRQAGAIIPDVDTLLVKLKEKGHI